MGRATAYFFGTAPGALERGQKVKYHYISISKSISNIFNQTVFVFSHMKDIKHIRWDFNLAAWVMPQGWDLGLPWGVNFFPEIQPDLVCELLT